LLQGLRAWFFSKYEKSVSIRNRIHSSEKIHLFAEFSSSICFKKTKETASSVRTVPVLAVSELPVLLLCAPMLLSRLKLRCFRCSRERQHVTNIAHSGKIHNHTLEAQTVTGMLYAAVFTQIQIPP